ncbi:hypothetical protein CYMTET_54820 [Cymbomonas tetramitiformis]|uniref:Uncharacterized protein n=1 Tax=Cymbomonas tetramitiformis TaxID=36881 RepID=A0AAE0BE46_9CHLO|nr:hypothetical protein CYMTET_54820 [Cymbomonas tetramitiformis]
MANGAGQGAQSTASTVVPRVLDLVEVGVPRMEYVKGALLLVPDALSRRPDFVDEDPRKGLQEAGVLDEESDLPNKDPLSVLDAGDLFEDAPPSSPPKWISMMDSSWLAAVDVLVDAETAMEAAGEIGSLTPLAWILTLLTAPIVKPGLTRPLDLHDLRMDLRRDPWTYAMDLRQDPWTYIRSPEAP